MSAYIIVDLTVKDAEKLSQYSTAAAPTVAKFNGQFLTKGKIQPLHGVSAFQNKAVIQFPDTESALSWYASPEYQQLIALRNDGMDCQFHLVG
ncbi:MAG: hypothetical protein JWR40_5288 [Massilia sp.]|nr:hypothetical protein [Massilia sp.]MDB5953034.1 hypothetical protein [Massilia sp.]